MDRGHVGKHHERLRVSGVAVRERERRRPVAGSTVNGRQQHFETLVRIELDILL